MKRMLSVSLCNSGEYDVVQSKFILESNILPGFYLFKVKHPTFTASFIGWIEDDNAYFQTVNTSNTTSITLVYTKDTNILSFIGNGTIDYTGTTIEIWRC